MGAAATIRSVYSDATIWFQEYFDTDVYKKDFLSIDLDDNGGITYRELNKWITQKAEAEGGAWKTLLSNPEIIRFAHMQSASINTKKDEHLVKLVVGINDFRTLLVHIFAISILWVHFKNADDYRFSVDFGNRLLCFNEFKLAIRTITSSYQGEILTDDQMKEDFYRLDLDQTGSLKFSEVCRYCCQFIDPNFTPVDISEEADQEVSMKRLSLYIKYEQMNKAATDPNDINYNSNSNKQQSNPFPNIQYMNNEDIQEQEKLTNHLKQIQRELNNANDPINNNNNNNTINTSSTTTSIDKKNSDKLYVSPEINEELGSNHIKKTAEHFYTLAQKNASAFDALADEIERNKLSAKFVEVKYSTEKMIGDMRSTVIVPAPSPSLNHTLNSSSAPLLTTSLSSSSPIHNSNSNDINLDMNMTTIIEEEISNSNPLNIDTTSTTNRNEISLGIEQSIPFSQSNTTVQPAQQ